MRHWRIGALGLGLGFELLTYHAALGALLAILTILTILTILAYLLYLLWAHHAALGALLEVEAQLEQPLEVVDRGAARLGHPIEDVAPVDLGC